jgi:hypothetical protein
MWRMGRKGVVGGLDSKIKSETLRGSVFRVVPAVRQGTSFEVEPAACPSPLRVGLRRVEALRAMVWFGGWFRTMVASLGENSAKRQFPFSCFPELL